MHLHPVPQSHPQNGVSPMRSSREVVSIFLSHSSSDHELVTSVRRHLGRLGITGWFAPDRLHGGTDLHTALPEGMRSCLRVAAFLSPAAVRSKWVGEELATAIDLERKGIVANVIPVYLGDRQALVTGSPQLNTWLHPTRDDVSRLGIDSNPDAPDPGSIAKSLAGAVYRMLDTPLNASLGIVIDQRGLGEARVGELPQATVASRFLGASGPIITFRPDDGERTYYETITGNAWTALISDMSWALTRAPVKLAERHVRIAGAGQLGIGWFLGHTFNRSSRVKLTCYDRDGNILTNEDQSFNGPLAGGNPYCHMDDVPGASSVSGTAEVVDLVLLSEDPSDPNQPKPYFGKVTAFRATESESPPMVFVKTPRSILRSDQAMSLVADVVALLQRLSHTHGCQRIRLFTALPFHFLPLLAANLVNVMDQVVFMEDRKDLRSTRSQVSGDALSYSPLEFTTNAATRL